MISSRLKSLVSYVDSTDRVIDIGCDHALLGIYLIKNNILKHIVVSDNKELALQNGIDNINKYNLANYIIPRLGNGLDVVDESIDTVIISGMGASTILKMLNSKQLKFIKKFIIQSNNDHYLLRKVFVAKGFYITDEEVIYEKGRYYVNIVFILGKKKYSNSELMYGPLLLNSNRDYFEWILNKKVVVFKKVSMKHWLKKLLLWLEIKRLNRIVSRIK